MATCAQCGEENPSHHLTCKQCGEILATRAPPAPPPPAAGTTPSVYDNVVPHQGAAGVRVTVAAQARFMMPDACACCLAPALTQSDVYAQHTRGNETVTYTFNYPLCLDCDQHVRGSRLATGAGVSACLLTAIGGMIWRGSQDKLTWASAGVLMVVGILLGALTYFAVKTLKKVEAGPRCACDHEPLRLTDFDRDYVTVVFENGDFGEAFRKANFGGR